MAWALPLDDFSGSFCGQGQNPLLNAMKNALGGSGTPRPLPPTVSHMTTSSISSMATSSSSHTVSDATSTTSSSSGEGSTGTQQNLSFPPPFLTL